MPAYVPAVFIGQAALITTPTYYTLSASTTAVIRTVHAQANTTSQTFTLSLNGADAAGTRIWDAYALTANVPATFNGWWVNGTAGNSAIGMKSSTNSGTTCIGNVSGYTYT